LIPPAFPCPLRLLLNALFVLGLVVPGQLAADDSPTTGTVTRAAVAPVAPSGSGARVGFVDIEIVLGESRAVRQIAGEIDEELGRRDQEIREKRRELQKLRLSLEQQGSVLSDEERARRQQQALALISDIDEAEYRFNREVRRKQSTVIEPMLEQVVKLIGEVGQREGFDLIVRGETVLWGGRSVDLTPTVIRELDQRTEQLRAAVRRYSPAEQTVAPSPTPAPLLPLLP
jgi:outer membrane protein